MDKDLQKSIARRKHEKESDIAFSWHLHARHVSQDKYEDRIKSIESRYRRMFPKCQPLANGYMDTWRSLLLDRLAEEMAIHDGRYTAVCQSSFQRMIRAFSAIDNSDY